MGKHRSRRRMPRGWLQRNVLLLGTHCAQSEGWDYHHGHQLQVPPTPTPHSQPSPLAAGAGPPTQAAWQPPGPFLGQSSVHRNHLPSSLLLWGTFGCQFESHRGEKAWEQPGRRTVALMGLWAASHCLSLGPLPFFFTFLWRPLFHSFIHLFLRQAFTM